ncbi:MAG: RsmE family RNA methyltransferase, partial [Planctomycetota bacterium]
MNFLLLEPVDVAPDGTAVLRGRAAEHVRTVLRAEVGATLRAGLVDGPLGRATVTAMDAAAITVATQWERSPAPATDVLLLAVPRPKVLLRMLAHAAALGFGRIVLFRSWRVDKSWLDSTAMQPAVQREHLLAGLEQAGRTRIPRVHFCPLFKPMVEDELDALELPAARFVAHPAAATATAALALGPGPFALALGPDGGLLPYEVAQLHERGFLPVSCGPHALRTETALAVLAGQLALLRERSGV